MQTIRFQNKEWLFVGDSLEEGGAITTPESYENGTCSYAHLCSDGKVRRFRKVIGSLEDIEVIGPTQIKVDPLKAFFGIIADPSWNR